MDAAVNALSPLLALFAQLKRHPELSAGVFEEIVRLESPIQVD